MIGWHKTCLYSASIKTTAMRQSMSSIQGSSGSQLSDVYKDEKSKDYARLFRKHNGFSPDQILKAKELGNEIREKALFDKIDRFSKEEEAVLTADQHLRKFMKAAKALSNPNLAQIMGDKDAFGARMATLSSSAPNIDANNIMIVTPSFGAAEGSLKIKVDRIATKDKINGSIPIASKTTNITADESRIYIKGTPIKVPADATLEEIAGAINAQKGTTYVQAFARKMSDTDYRLFITTSKEGGKITLQTVVDKLAESFDSNSDPLGLAGTLEIGGEEKVITPTMGLTDIATLISTVPTFAAVVNGAGPYTLAVTENAVPVTITDVATEKLMGQLGIKESAATEQDLKAKYYIDGDATELYSATNHIEGLYHKTTIDLLAPSDGAEITADIGPNRAEVLSCIQEFMDAYNDFIIFADAQTAKDPKNDYKPKEGAYLAQNRQFINMVDRIKRMYSNNGTGGVTGLKHISEIGIKKDENGLLTKDVQKLATIIDTNLPGVEQIFAFISLNETGGYFQTITHPKKLPAETYGKNLVVSVTKNDAGEYSARLYLDDDGSVSEDVSIAIGNENIEVSTAGKVTIFGPEDSIYEGFRFAYLGPEIATPPAQETNTEDQRFRLSQGLGDLLSEQISDMVFLAISSNKEADQKNELNKVAYRARKEKSIQEKRLEELKAKHTKMMDQAKQKAERFQRDMEKVQELLATLTPMMASMFG